MLRERRAGPQATQALVLQDAREVDEALAVGTTDDEGADLGVGADAVELFGTLPHRAAGLQHRRGGSVPSNAGDHRVLQDHFPSHTAGGGGGRGGGGPPPPRAAR
ncbi:MAG: hypothetical protein ACK559_13645, partial [bacterium]